MGLITSFPGGNGGSEITVDNALSAASENPVQNKAITAELNKKANSNDIPTKLSQLGEDGTHRTVTDTEKSTWSGKQDVLTAGSGISIAGNVISAGIPIVANQFEKSDLYSTTEKVVGCWTDGRPIYQKVVDCGALPANTSKDVAHGINNLGLVIKGYLIVQHASAGIQISVPFVNPASTNLNIGVKVNATNIIITDASADYAVAFPTSYAILQYTKTTDKEVNQNG